MPDVLSHRSLHSAYTCPIVPSSALNSSQYCFSKFPVEYIQGSSPLHIPLSVRSRAQEASAESGYINDSKRALLCLNHIGDNDSVSPAVTTEPVGEQIVSRGSHFRISTISADQAWFVARVLGGDRFSSRIHTSEIFLAIHDFNNMRAKYET
ncbi:hypothetical protein BDR22DRAFT_176751 [Usnea florida]